MQTLLLVSTATATALIGGLFYAYSCSVNAGLGRLSDVQYVAAMKSINAAILNPLFMASFLGTLVLLPVSTYVHYGDAGRTRFYFLLAATIVYVTGVFGVTILGNVPLNEALARFDWQHASTQAVTEQRTRFEIPWNRLHRIRSLASFICIVLVTLACVSTDD